MILYLLNIFSFKVSNVNNFTDYFNLKKKRFSYRNFLTTVSYFFNCYNMNVMSENINILNKDSPYTGIIRITMKLSFIN